MITAVLGRPGAGKSYEAVRLVDEALDAGRQVSTNLPLVGEHWEVALEAGRLHLHDDVLDEDGWLSQPVHWEDLLSEKYLTPQDEGPPLGQLVVLDEAARIWSTRRRAKGPAGQALQDAIDIVIATHRHSRVDFVLLGQTHHQLPETVKPQVEEWVELTGLRRHGVQGYRWRAYSTWWGPAREPLRSGFRRYDPERFSRYSSHALGSGGEGGGETVIGFVKSSIWFRWQWAVPILGVGGLLWLGPAVARDFGGWLGLSDSGSLTRTQAMMRSQGQVAGDDDVEDSGESRPKEAVVRQLEEKLDELKEGTSAKGGGGESGGGGEVYEGAVSGEPPIGMPRGRYLGWVGEWIYFADGAWWAGELGIQGWDVIIRRPGMLVLRHAASGRRVLVK